MIFFPVAFSTAMHCSAGMRPRFFHIETSWMDTPSVDARGAMPPASSIARSTTDGASGRSESMSAMPLFLTDRYEQINDSLRRATNGGLRLAGMTKKRSITPTATQRKDYGKRLADAIDRAGRTQVWVAEQLHCTEAQVSKMCKHGAGGLWAFAQACDLIGASLDYVVLGTYPKADEWFVDRLKQMMGTQVPAADGRAAT